MLTKSIYSSQTYLRSLSLVLFSIYYLFFLPQPLIAQNHKQSLPQDIFQLGYHVLTVDQLARLCAPILVFSPDEPLLVKNSGIKPVPHIIPGVSEATTEMENGRKSQSGIIRNNHPQTNEPTSTPDSTRVFHDYTKYIFSQYHAAPTSIPPNQSTDDQLPTVYYEFELVQPVNAFLSAEKQLFFPLRSGPVRVIVGTLHKDDIYSKFPAYYLKSRNGIFQLSWKFPGAESDSVNVVYRMFPIMKVRGDSLLLYPRHNKMKARLRYYYYFESETGFKQHQHDLEGIELTLKLDSRKIKIERIQAFAHGPVWYHNILDLQKLSKRERVAFPIRILIEEGKHASCPDRNADGYYSPGFDINLNLNDAWGIRDIVGSGKVGTPKYGSWMSKVRHDSSAMVFPPKWDWEFEFLDPTHSKIEGFRTFYHNYDPYTDALPRYNLLPLPNSIADLQSPQEIKELLKKNRIGERSASGKSITLLSKSALAIRFANGPGFSVVVPNFILEYILGSNSVPVLGGYSTIRSTFIFDPNRLSSQISYIPSAARYVDWFIGAGVESYTSNDWYSLALVELGVKGRLPKYLISSSIGIRSNPTFDSFRNSHLFFEFAFGYF